MLTPILLLIAIVWVLVILQMGRTLLALGCFLFSLLILSLGTLLGCFAQLFINQSAMKAWHLSFMTTAIVDSAWFGNNFWFVFFIPAVFVLDLVWLNVQVIVLQPTLGTLMGGGLGIWGAARVWYYGIQGFKQGMATYGRTDAGGENWPMREFATAFKEEFGKATNRRPLPDSKSMKP